MGTYIHAHAYLYVHVYMHVYIYIYLSEVTDLHLKKRSTEARQASCEEGRRADSILSNIWVAVTTVMGIELNHKDIAILLQPL